MKNLIHRTVVLVTLLFLTVNVFAQYDASSSFSTSYFNATLPPSQRSIGGTACDVITYEPRKTNYAIVGMNHASAPNCGRYVNFYQEAGNLVASSNVLFSEIHTLKTKVLFDPKDPNCFYVLYQEHRVEDIGMYPPDDDFRTYLRRFKYVAPNTTLAASPRLEIFDHSNSVDFAIADNGDAVIVGVTDHGRVQMRSVRNMNIIPWAGPMVYTVPLSDNFEALRQHGAINHELWEVSMDIKDNQVAVAHTKGNGSYYSLSGKSVRLVRFDYAPFGSGFTMYDNKEDEIYGQILSHDNTTPRQLGMRVNGDVVYITRVPSGGGDNTYNLAKIKASGPAIPSYIFTEAPSANDVVVSEDDKIYVAGVEAGAHVIGLFNAYDEFEHLYDVHSNLDNPTDDIAVDHCTILASGHTHSGDFVYSAHHQLFDCDDCDGNGPHADFNFKGQLLGEVRPTYYGPHHWAIYCDIDDLVIDGSDSRCENSYWVAINRMDVSTWTILEYVHGGWINLDGEVPVYTHVADYLSPGTTFIPGADYLLTLTVGLTGGAAPLHSEHKLFELQPSFCNRTAGSEPEVAAQSATVYPNPSQGLVNIEVSNADLPTDYTVINMRGQQVGQGAFIGSTQIDLQGQPAGIYLIQLNNGQETFTKKVIVE